MTGPFLTSSLGVKRFILLQIIVVIFITRAIIAQHSKNKFEIKETSEHIVVNTKIYSLTIDKPGAFVSLSNRQGIPYTSFPLDVQFNSNESANNTHLHRQWKIQDRGITMLAALEDMIEQEIKILCSDESFEIQFTVRIPGTAEIGAYLLRRPGAGWDKSNWEEYFSPEPDDFLKANPTVDIRIDRDQQWTFAPAPLNLSFKTRAGWFSIGLLELPDASIYAFKDDALWIDFPWQKLPLADERFYKFPLLVLTFNNSAWEAVGDFSRQIIKNNKHWSRASNTSQKPVWWTKPLVSTWGEQRVQHITFDHPEFNANWVKNYVTQQQKAWDSLKFNLIIENKWSQADGDPAPSNRFHNLRNLIDWCHVQGIKVILFWKAWKVEANSLPINLGVCDGEYVDATHPFFESYVDSCCELVLGNGDQGLNADGLKIDELFLVRDPGTANYRDSRQGVGFKEVYRYLETFYRCAKKYKADALIMSSAIDPHFNEVQDMVRINDDWDNKTRREKRARIITRALPGMLINGDAADMSEKIAPYHYVTSAIYGIPSIQYLTRFHDGAISSDTKTILTQLLALYAQKPEGELCFVDYGNWQIRNQKDEVVAESVPAGKGLLLYRNNREASFLCTENSTLHLVIEHHLLKTIEDESGIKIPFTDLGNGLYELLNLKQGKIYRFQLKRISHRKYLPLQQ